MSVTTSDVESVVASSGASDTNTWCLDLAEPARLDVARRVLRGSARVFSVLPTRLLERDRSRDVVSARYVAAWLLRRRRWHRFQIGTLLGLDYSSLYYGLHRVDGDSTLLVAAEQVDQLLDADNDRGSFQRPAKCALDLSDVSRNREGRASPEDDVERGVVAERVRDAVGALPQRKRQVLELLYYEHNGSYAAVAKQLGINRGYVFRIHARALEQLRAPLAPLVS